MDKSNKPSAAISFDKMLSLEEDFGVGLGVPTALLRGFGYVDKDDRGTISAHQPRFEQSKRPLYYAALARAKQGKHDLAEELATKAAALPPQTRLEGVAAAKDMEQHGQFDWAVREPCAVRDNCCRTARADKWAGWQ